MSIGKKLLVFSSTDPKAHALTSQAGDWSCIVTVAESVHDFRGKVEGGDYDLVLTESSASLRRLIGEADPIGDILRTPLAEIERRHIERVLSSTGGNKTRSARILGIDTKTLYNKLKSYASADQAAQHRSFAKQPRGKTG